MKRPHLPVLFAASIILSACSFSLAEDITPPPGSQQQASVDTRATPVASGPLYPLVAPNPEEGAALYAEKCAPCHGDTGQGDGPQALQLPNPATAIGSAAVAHTSTPAQWFNIVTRGNLDRYMPPFPSLSDRQRWDILAYVYSLSTSPESLALGQALYNESCAGCHGESGRGDGPATLTTRPPNFTDQSFMAKKSTADFYQAISTGSGTEMHDFSASFSEEERWALAGHMRFMSFRTTGSLASSAPTSSPTPSGDGPSEALAEPQASGETQLEEAGERTGTITGAVKNGSGGEPLASLAVTIHGFDSMAVAYTGSTTTGPDGVFVVEGVPLETGRAFLATIEYEQGTYGSQVAVVEDGMDELTLEIVAYETTTDISTLTADRLHVFLDFTTPNIVEVIELYIMSNSGNKTIIPAEEGGPVAVFPLPEGAANLQFQDGALGERYIEVPGGFADTMALQPTAGEYQVLYAYELPYNRKLDLKHPLNLPVEAVIILQPEGNVKVKSDQLTEGGARPIQGVNYLVYSGGPFPAGTTLTVNLSGRPEAGAATLAPSGSQSLILGMGAFGVVLLASGVWLYRRSKNEAELEEEFAAGALEHDEPDDRDSLIEAIIALDDLYQAGELPEEAYHERRAELKTRLKTIAE